MRNYIYVREKDSFAPAAKTGGFQRQCQFDAAALQSSRCLADDPEFCLRDDFQIDALTAEGRAGDNLDESVKGATT